MTDPQLETEARAEDGVEPIAVIGMACRVPGASTVTQFWHNMRDGVESITRFTPEQLLAAGVDPQTIADPDYVPAGGVIDDADRFDAAFFGYNPREAETMDPQQRVLVETAWAALEDAGHDPARTDGAIGVFAGMFMNKYLMLNLGTNKRFQRSPMAPLARVFNDKDFLATRLAYLFDLDGPAYTVQTACSTSLVATHLACQSLQSYESDLALVGGVAINLPLGSGYPMAAGGLFSPDGHCRPFDAHASGTVPGNGAVMLVLRRLSDAIADRDHVYALIRATAVNNDGALKAGYTAPSVDGQAKVITTAQTLAGVDPATIGYLEAHGTATQVGDPIEVAALTQAFRTGTDARGSCALGSVKANIGHLDAAAGVAGLMRAALALRHRQIPPSLHFTAPNPELRLETSPFYVPTEAREWPAGSAPRRAGVSSFGVGGTNAHAILEEAPEPPASGEAKPWQLVTLSGRNRAAVEAATGRLADHLAAHPSLSLADVAYTLQDGRRDFAVRRFVACTDVEDLTAVLRGEQAHRLVTRTAPEGDQQVVFMFPGGGSQHREMGADIYRSEPVFRSEVDRCAEILAPRLGMDLREVLFPSVFGAAADTARQRKAALGRGEGASAVSALFVIEYALAKLWMSWGVTPAAMIGHSLGEYVAACLAGVFTLPEALEITLARGELFSQMPPGTMLAAQLPEAELLPFLNDRVSVSAVNAPNLTVAAGPDEEIEALLDTLRAKGVECSRVSVPVASHSWMVEPFLDEFRAKVKGYDLRAPRTPFISCATGTWITAAEATDPEYWVSHLRRPVRFADGIRAALAQPGRVLLEVGPGRALSALVGAQQIAPAPVAVPSMGHARDKLPGLAHLMAAVGRLWQGGVGIDWRALHGEANPRRVSLPGYPFERTRHWVAAGAQHLDDAPEVAPAAEVAPEPDDDFVAPRTETERMLAGIWADLLGVDRIGVDDDLFAAGAHSMMITQVTKELHRRHIAHLTARDVLQAPTIGVLAELVDGGATSHSGPDLAAEVVLDPAITAAGLPAPADGPARRVLLTGGTGFVGSFLLAELGRQTTAEICCLVRAATEEEGEERLRAALASYGLTPPSRLRVVLGDLARPRLGLTEAAFDELAERVDVIYHCGAWVNFVRPYRALKNSNVRGTEEVLRLATRARLKPVHHVSTLAVLAGAIAAGATEIMEDAPLPPPIGHDTAYSQSKWVAEGLIELARERGVPVSVYRAGAVLCDSRTGAANREDYVTKVIQGCVELGMAPLREYPLAVASVDHTARMVVGLSLRAANHGRTYHVIDPRPLAWNDIFAHLRDFGYPVRSVSWEKWRAELTEQVEVDDSANALAPLMAMLGDTPDRQMPRMDCANVLAGLSAELAASPGLDAGFFARMFGFFVRGGWLPAPTQTVEKEDRG